MESQKNRYKNSQINIILHDQKKVHPTSANKIHYLNNNPFKEIDQHFSDFIGMEKLKLTIKEIYATVVVNEKRKQMGKGKTDDAPCGGQIADQKQASER